MIATSCSLVKHKTIWIKGENHSSMYDARWKSLTIKRAHMGEINIMLEGYFPEENIGNNTLGIEDPITKNLTNCLNNYNRASKVEDINFHSKIEKDAYLRTITGTFFLYDKIKYYKYLIADIGLNPPTLNSSMDYVKKFCHSVVSYHANNTFKKYRNELIYFLSSNGVNQKVLWDKIVVGERDKTFADNIAKNLERVNPNKETIIVVGKRHVSGLMALLLKKGIITKELIIIRRKRTRW